jgi:hypothetical protein
MSDAKERFCEPCRYGKQTATPNHTPQARAKARLERIHIDLAGGGATLPLTTDTISVLDPGSIPDPDSIPDEEIDYNWQT